MYSAIRSGDWRLVDFREQVESQRLTLQTNVDELQQSQAQLANAQRLARIGSWSFDMAT